jgi:hypothetical protein
MGKSLMIQPDDDARIEKLKKQTGTPTKIEVVRKALSLLEAEVVRKERVKRWKNAARLVAENSSGVLRDFQPHSLLKRI